MPRSMPMDIPLADDMLLGVSRGPCETGKTIQFIKEILSELKSFIMSSLELKHF